MPQPEDLQKSRTRCIQQRPPQFLRPPDNPHQVALDQLSQEFAALDAADRLDLGPQHRLPIGHDGQGFQGRGGQSDVDRARGCNRRSQGASFGRVINWNPPATSSTRNALPSASYRRFSTRTSVRAFVPSAKPANWANFRLPSGCRARKRIASNFAAFRGRAGDGPSLAMLPLDGWVFGKKFPPLWRSVRQTLACR